MKKRKKWTAVRWILFIVDEPYYGCSFACGGHPELSDAIKRHGHGTDIRKIRMTEI